MPLSTYPTLDDVSEILTEAGVTLPSSGRMARALDAATQRFEDLTGRHPMLAQGATTRHYSPPDGPNGILFVDDLVSVTSVLYSPPNGAAQTLVLGQDFSLAPRNAPVKKLPYDRIEFRRRWTQPIGVRYQESLAITGWFGYGLTFPPDAYEAMVYDACASLMPSLNRALSGGIKSIREGSDGVTYALGDTGDQWAQQYADTVAKYRRVTLEVF